VEKQLVIKINVVNGEVSFENDDMSFFEALGAIEVVKLMIGEQFLED
jgi:hypothetical protein